jgi:hypothetical protein
MGDKTDSFRKFFYFRYVEKWFCKKANYLTVPTAGSVNAYYPEFRHKIEVIPQGFDFNEVVIPAYQKNSIPTFAYAGGFIPGVRDPKQLLGFLCALNQPFKFIIYTNNEDYVSTYVGLSANRIEVRPYIPREKLLVELSHMDFLININNGTAVQTPSKLIDYALTQRPILSINSSEGDLEIVRQFLNGDYDRRLQVGDLSKYEIKEVAGQFIGLAKNRH